MTKEYCITRILYCLFVLDSFHLNFIFNELVHIGNNCTSLNIHQHK